VYDNLIGEATRDFGAAAIEIVQIHVVLASAHCHCRE
jgi:hypothetical protein